MNKQTPDREMLRQWVERWKVAGEALERIKRRERRGYDVERDFPAIDAMLQWAYEHRRPRPTSGLIEQQRLFMQWREQLLQAKQTEENHERPV